MNTSKIQWFPGHMNKAKKEIRDLLVDIDVVVELLDARAPFSSCNPLLQNLIKHKKKLRLLNKSDLANQATTEKWLDFFNDQENEQAIASTMHNQKQAKKIVEICKNLAPNRNSFEKPLRIMISGIPNVGKSTLINQLIGRKIAKTGDIPAVTKSNQRITYNDNIIIYDTPGMMWQKIAYPQVGYNLAICNSIGRNALDEELLAIYLIDYLAKHYPNELISRYKLSTTQITETPENIINLIGKNRGAIMSGGIIDIQKISEIIINDFRQAKFGLISLETPNQWKKWIKEFKAEERRLLEQTQINEEQRQQD